ncbi:hypothetical protein [Saccharopolyspora sp. CA-218241]|uniref:hypothetical protein n=1 Tax=Saccharopolyspora sp. CA-218241 TaxID=3240027 RepID=UPI003D97F26E
MSRWDTVRPERAVLGVVRTLTALDRLLDVLPVLADDLRVETRFAVAAGSPFGADLGTALRAAGVPEVAWSQAGRFDLALSPSSNGALHELGIPLVTLPHGAGHAKLRATEHGHSPEVSGLSRTQLLHRGRVVPTAVGLAHQDQVAVLRRSCPEAVPRAEVVGDPCYDRLAASLPMREHYRRELGTGDRTLVLLASTWGEHSLFGARGGLAAELVDLLPPERYQVALVLHPNVWTRHTRMQLELWTRRARAGGLLLVPPLRAWQAAMVAADVVISDHGSLTCYAAALGKRLLLGAFGGHELVPGSSAELIGRRAERLTTPSRAAVDAAAPLPGHGELAERTFGPRSAARLRALLYRLLDLPEPDWPVRTEPVEPFSP